VSDEELLDRIGLDPATGLRDVMSAIGPMLLGRLRRHARVRRYGDAEVDDVFQDALLRLLRPEVRAEIRRAGGEILPWLSRWGYWRLDDAARKRAAEAARASAPADPAPADLPGASEAASVVTAAVARLSPRDQSILRWRYEERVSNGEIGKRLDVTEGAAKKAAHDARERLRKVLDDSGVRYE
jgi:RNA polymerase sigma factor (sigma-70 family)